MPQTLPAFVHEAVSGPKPVECADDAERIDRIAGSFKPFDRGADIGEVGHQPVPKAQLLDRVIDQAWAGMLSE